MDSSRRGAALLLVLWGLVILSGLTLATLTRTKSDLSLVSARETLIRLKEAGETGVAVGAARIAEDETVGTTSLKVGDAAIVVTIVREGGRLDLNFAAADLLKGLFQAQLGPDGERLADQVIRLRDPDGDLPLTHPSALLRYGIGDDQYTALSPYLTVHTRQRGFDPLSAPRAVLMSVPRANATTVDAFILWRVEQAGPPPAMSFVRPYTQPPLPIYRVVVDVSLHGRNSKTSAVLSIGADGAITRLATYRD